MTMNRETMRELLTAALDGVLPPAERKIVQRLLHESPEARALFAQLKQDAARLQALRKHHAPVDFAAAILHQIQDNGLTPTPLPPKPATPPKKFNWGWLPVWTNIVTAASVLLLISIGSYLYFMASQDYLAGKKSQELIAQTGQRTLVEGPGTTSQHNALPLPEAKLPPEAIVALPPVPSSPEVGPLPRVVERDILTSPIRPSPEIDFTQLDLLRVAQLFKINDLPTNDATRKKLVADCKRDELIRLDLFCKLTPKSVEAVQQAFKAKGVTFHVDAYAQERLKKNLPTEIMFFTESLTPDEVSQVLAHLGAEDNKANGAGGYDTLVVAPFLSADLDTLGRLLGITNVLSKLPKMKGVDIRKPLPEGTALQLAQTLAKMGSTGTPLPKEERVGVAVAYRPSNPQPNQSKEIKTYLSRRGEKKPDAKPLMLVLRAVQ